MERKYLLSENGVVYASKPFLETFGSIEELKALVLDGGTCVRQGYLSARAGLAIADTVECQVPFRPKVAFLRQEEEQFYFGLRNGSPEAKIKKQISAAQFHDYWSQTRGNRVVKMHLDLPFCGKPLEVIVFTDHRDLVIAKMKDTPQQGMAPGRDITLIPEYKKVKLAR